MGRDDADFINPVSFPADFNAELPRRDLDKLPYGMLLTSGDDKIVRFFLLQHEPLEVTKCDLQFLNSPFENSNIKSSGNLSIFLLTAVTHSSCGT